MMTGLQLPSSPYHSVLTGTGIGAGSEARLCKHRLTTMHRNKAIFDIENCCPRRLKVCRSDSELRQCQSKLGPLWSSQIKTTHNIDNERESRSSKHDFSVKIVPIAGRNASKGLFSNEKLVLTFDEEGVKASKSQWHDVRLWGVGLSDLDRQSALGDPRSPRPGVSLANG